MSVVSGFLLTISGCLAASEIGVNAGQHRHLVQSARKMGEPSHARPCYRYSTEQGSFAMATLEMGGLIVLGIIALDVGLGYALARWDIDI